MKKCAYSTALRGIGLVIAGSIVLLIGCKKSERLNTQDHEQLKAYVAAKEPSEIQRIIDWSKVEESAGPERLIRVGFKYDDFGSRFILFKVNATGFVEGAVEVQLNFSTQGLNGMLYRRTIGQTARSEHVIVNGYLTDDTELLTGEYDGPTGPPMLAKIIPDPRYNIGTITMQYNALYYVNIRQAYDALGKPSNEYQLTGGERKNDYGGSGTYTSSVTGYPKTIIVDSDLNYEAKPMVDVERMISCFSAVPDQGADCSITIFTDIPVNERADFLVNYKERYAGHCFLQLRKSNQGKMVKQHIGFYPNTSIKSMATTAPITGRLVNDEMHGYNASFEMKITFIQLSVILQEIRRCQVKGVRYDVDNYNCADFALQIFNLARSNDPLLPQKYQLPDAPYNPHGTNLPHGVYRELAARKKTKPADRPQIAISTANLYSDFSSKACY